MTAGGGRSRLAAMRLHPRHRIDAGAAEVAFAAWACVGAHDRVRHWSPAADELRRACPPARRSTSCSAPSTCRRAARW